MTPYFVTPNFGLLTHDELFVIAVVALVLVLRNLWDFVRYDLDHVEAEAAHLATHPLETVATFASHALAAAAFPHAKRPASRRARPVRRASKAQQA